MLTKKGLKKVRNGKLRKGFLEGYCIITLTFPDKATMDIHYKLLDVNKKDILSEEIHRVCYQGGDTVDIHIGELKKLIEVKAT